MRLFFEELLIGFEFKNFLIALAVLFIIYLAWESTYVRDYHVQPNAVLIIENNRRLLFDIGPNVQRDLRSGTDWSVETAHSTPTNIGRVVDEGTEPVVDITSRNESIPEPPPSLEVVIEEVHGLASVRHQLNENAFRTLESLEGGISEFFDHNESGPQHLIHAMDTTEGVRRRRVDLQSNEDNTYATSSQATNESASASPPIQGGGDTTDANVGIKNKSGETKSILNETDDKENIAEKDDANNQPGFEEKKDEFRIKLKYLNDDTKLVKGSPDEKIGDFKKRNFTLELSAQKFVRLVFNGHVLQPDTKTLQACGLFDNCVVHCLVHNRNPNLTAQNQRGGQPSIGAVGGHTIASTGDADLSNNNGQSAGNFSIHDSSNHLIVMYVCIAFITLFLALCWYCRIQYHVFFSWYSTLVLILVTIIFSILGPLLVFIENNEGQQTT